jgi:hypothetical protein
MEMRDWFQSLPSSEVAAFCSAITFNENYETWIAEFQRLYISTRSTYLLANASKNGDEENRTDGSIAIPSVNDNGKFCETTGAATALRIREPLVCPVSRQGDGHLGSSLSTKSLKVAESKSLASKALKQRCRASPGSSVVVNDSLPRTPLVTKARALSRDDEGSVLDARRRAAKGVLSKLALVPVFGDKGAGQFSDSERSATDPRAHVVLTWHPFSLEGGGAKQFVAAADAFLETFAGDEDAKYAPPFLSGAPTSFKAAPSSKTMPFWFDSYRRQCCSSTVSSIETPPLLASEKDSVLLILAKMEMTIQSKFESLNQNTSFQMPAPENLEHFLNSTSPEAQANCDFSNNAVDVIADPDEDKELSGALAVNHDQQESPSRADLSKPDGSTRSSAFDFVLPASLRSHEHYYERFGANIEAWIRGKGVNTTTVNDEPGVSAAGPILSVNTFEAMVRAEEAGTSKPEAKIIEKLLQEFLDLAQNEVFATANNNAGEAVVEMQGGDAATTPHIASSVARVLEPPEDAVEVVATSNDCDTTLATNNSNSLLMQQQTTHNPGSTSHVQLKRSTGDDDKQRLRLVISNLSLIDSALKASNSSPQHSALAQDPPLLSATVMRLTASSTTGEVTPSAVEPVAGTSSRNEPSEGKGESVSKKKRKKKKKKGKNGGGGSGGGGKSKQRPTSQNRGDEEKIPAKDAIEASPPSTVTNGGVEAVPIERVNNLEKATEEQETEESRPAAEAACDTQNETLTKTAGPVGEDRGATRAEDLPSSPKSTSSPGTVCSAQSNSDSSSESMSLLYLEPSRYHEHQHSGKHTNRAEKTDEKKKHSKDNSTMASKKKADWSSQSPVSKASDLMKNASPNKPVKTHTSDPPSKSLKSGGGTISATKVTQQASSGASPQKEASIKKEEQNHPGLSKKNSEKKDASTAVQGRPAQAPEEVDQQKKEEEEVEDDVWEVVVKKTKTQKFAQTSNKQHSGNQQNSHHGGGGKSSNNSKNHHHNDRRSHQNQQQHQNQHHNSGKRRNNNNHHNKQQEQNQSGGGRQSMLSSQKGKITEKSGAGILLPASKGNSAAEALISSGLSVTALPVNPSAGATLSASETRSASHQPWRRGQTLKVADNSGECQSNSKPASAPASGWRRDWSQIASPSATASTTVAAATSKVTGSTNATKKDPRPSDRTIKTSKTPSPPIVPSAIKGSATNGFHSSPAPTKTAKESSNNQTTNETSSSQFTSANKLPSVQDVVVVRDESSSSAMMPVPTLLGVSSDNSASSSVSSSLGAHPRPPATQYDDRHRSNKAKSNHQSSSSKQTPPTTTSTSTTTAADAVDGDGDVDRDAVITDSTTTEGYHLLDVCDRLTKDIQVFMERRAAALQCRREERQALLQALDTTVAQIWNQNSTNDPLNSHTAQGQPRVEIMGSCATQLDLPSSDLDVVICGLPPLPLMPNSASHSALPGVGGVIERGLSESNSNDRVLQDDSASVATSDSISAGHQSHSQSTTRRQQSIPHSHSQPLYSPHASPHAFRHSFSNPSSARVVRLAFELEQQPWAVQVQPIPTAKVPVIKLLADPSKLPPSWNPARSASDLQDVAVNHENTANEHELYEVASPCSARTQISSLADGGSLRSMLVEDGDINSHVNEGMSQPPQSTIPSSSSPANLLQEPHPLAGLPPNPHPWRGADLMNGLLSIDITFEGPGHGGVGSTLYASQVVEQACREHFAEQPHPDEQGVFGGWGGHDGGVAVDEEADAVQNMLLHADETPAVQLIIVLKELLAQKRLNEPFSGGLSSYSVLLMVCAALRECKALRDEFEFAQQQHHHPPIGPFPALGDGPPEGGPACNIHEANHNQGPFPAMGNPEMGTRKSLIPSSAVVKPGANSKDQPAQQNFFSWAAVASNNKSKPNPPPPTGTAQKGGGVEQSAPKKLSYAERLAGNSQSTSAPNVHNDAKKTASTKATPKSTEKARSKAEDVASKGGTAHVHGGSNHQAHQPDTRDATWAPGNELAGDLITGNIMSSDMPMDAYGQYQSSAEDGYMVDPNNYSQMAGNDWYGDSQDFFMLMSSNDLLRHGAGGCWDTLEVLCRGEPTSGKLLMYFFLLFGKIFDAQNTVVDMLAPEPTPFVSRQFMPMGPAGQVSHHPVHVAGTNIDPMTGAISVDPIVVYDPLEGEEGKNVARSCFAWYSIQKVLGQCYTTLTQSLEASTSARAHHHHRNGGVEGRVDVGTPLDRDEDSSPLLALLLSY